MSVFEIPQKQWATVMGANLWFNTVDGHPVESVTWEKVRGGFWPIDFLIPQTSFVGAVGASTGLDLSSEAQWKYAFRADSAGAYNVTSQPIDNLGWYVGNSDGSGQYAHQKVGTGMPNAWGLYDMHGNVSEICGEWFNEACLADSTAPQGSLDEVVLRGGSYLLPGIQCRSANRAGLWYPIGINYAGFRVVVNLVQ